MALNTYKTYLMHKAAGSGSSWEKLVDIKDYPDLGSDPELLETTTLSDKMRTYIMGIQSNEGMSFNANYTKAAYTALAALEGSTEEYAVWFGASVSGSTVTPDGSDGKFEFQGQLAVHVTGGGVNEVRNMVITIAPTTEITES